MRQTTRKNKDGSKVTYLQLAESIYDKRKRKPVHRIVHNFGRKEDIDTDALKRLMQSIGKYLDEPLLLPDAGDCQDLWSKSYGAIHIIQHLWKELGLDKTLQRVARQHKHTTDLATAIFLMVANRMIAPTSKLSCEEWCKEDVYIEGGEKFEVHHFYRAMDILAEHKYQVEHNTYFSVADLLNMDVDLIFYDTTSVYCEIDEEDSEETTDQTLRKRGHSKDGKGDLPQVVIGLAVTRDGYPVRSWVFDGNTSDVSTIAQVKRELRGWRLNRSIWCADRGMVSKENLAHFSAGGSSYIVGRKLRAGDEVQKEVLNRRGRFKAVADNLEVKEVIIGEGERRRRYIVCYNPLRAKRDEAYRGRAVSELEAELAGGDVTVETLKGRTISVSQRYKRYLRITKTGKLRVDRAKVKAETHLDGKFILQTNDDSLSAEDVALGYKQLMRVEEAFRTLKGSLNLRPMHHRLRHRIEAHVVICVLGLLLERVAENRSGQTWRDIRKESMRLHAIHRVHKDGEAIRLTWPNKKLCDLFVALDVPKPPPTLKILNS